MTDPAVAVAAYSYQGSRWLADKTAVRMSGAPKVGIGELSRIARKKSPRAPRCCKEEVKLRGGRRGRCFCSRLSIFAIYQAGRDGSVDEASRTGRILSRVSLGRSS